MAPLSPRCIRLDVSDRRRKRCTFSTATLYRTNLNEFTVIKLLADFYCEHNIQLGVRNNLNELQKN